ncbi:MAG: neutral/alkaline non-lysosomal ceramidase N-terminal domain-containing protein [Gemmataceae bacterium]
MSRLLSFLCLLSVPAFAAAQDWQAGLAKTVITPKESMWLSGYGGRTKPAEGKISDLHAKACLLKSPAGKQALLISLDLVGIERGLSDRILSRLKTKVGLNPDQVMLACSHTHSGPVVGKNLRAMYFLDAKQQKLVDDYTVWLEDRIAAVADAARRDLAPARLSWAIGSCGFAVNRRNNKEKEIETIIKERKLQGPVDHDAPVLAIHGNDGKLRGVVLGYACHATVLSGYEWCADYPGFAMTKLEDDHPGAVALFWAGCGGDQNPLPRRSVPLAKKYGAELADAVNKVLAKDMHPVKGDLNFARKNIPLAFDMLPSHEQLAKDAAAKDKYIASRAKLWLDRLAKGEKMPETYSYPVQLWRLGDITWVSLGGEVTVDYSLRLKKELTPGKTWVTAYANDVMAYIPSRRVLKEGGYEGGGAMVYYGLPAIWGPEVEETIVRAVHEVAK